MKIIGINEGTVKRKVIGERLRTLTIKGQSRKWNEKKSWKKQTNKRPNNVERTSGRQFFMTSKNESLLFIFS